MKQIFVFLAGIVFVSLISAGTATVMTVKLQQPKSVVVKRVDAQRVSQYVIDYTKQGYIVKSCSISGTEAYGWSILIFEKY